MARSDKNLESTFLMILGHDLDPNGVSRRLRLKADRDWRRGEPRTVGSSSHEWGGWKRFPPESVSAKSLAAQLSYWVRLLDPRKRELRRMSRDGNLCVLDVFVLVEDVAFAKLEPEILRRIADLGIELQFTFQVDERERHGASQADNLEYPKGRS